MLGTWPTGQPPWPHPMLQLWVSSNEPCQPSQDGEPGANTRLNMLWTQGHEHKLVISRSIRCQEHHQCLYFHVLVLRSRNAKELIEQRSKSWLLFHLALCDSHRPLTTLLPAQKLFPLFLLQRWLVNNISTWLLSLVDGTQLTISWDPEMSSFVLCFCPFTPTRFIKQSPPKKHKCDCNPLKAFESPRSILSIKEGTHLLHPG